MPEAGNERRQPASGLGTALDSTNAAAGLGGQQRPTQGDAGEAERAKGAQSAGGRGEVAVLVVAGTHGNERNAVWLLDQWRRDPGLLHSSGLELEFTLGNPAAIAARSRYVDRDLNRSFQPALLNDPHNQQQEVQRARELLQHWGPAGDHPCPVVFDLHSTTAAMGNSLVVYGRRPADLALAAGVQGQLGLPVYLHERDPHQCGYLVEQWPCGLVIEVGPVPQGVVNARICQQTQLALETALAVLAEARRGALRLPPELVVHRHLHSLDRPRRANGEPCAVLHPQRQDRDWQPLRPGDPLFLSDAGATIGWAPQTGDPPVVWPLFINEAAYDEKGIALSLSQRETWPVSDSWGAELSLMTTRLSKP